ATAVAAGIMAKKLAEQSKQAGGYAGLIGTLVGAGVGAGLVTQIKPDLRCWHTLPANLQLARLFLRPGNHKVVVKFRDAAGNQVSPPVESTIQITKGERTFYNYRTLF
nr:hypothetical protein [Spirochaetota bacterium]